MAEQRTIVFILLCCLFNYVQSNTLLCTQAYCETYISQTGCATLPVHCRANNATHSGLTLPSPTTCNCCDYCLPLYLEGEHCSTGGPGTGTTIGRCADGLTCALDSTDGDTKCTRMTSECHTLQDEYDAREALGELGALEQRPMCDGKGRHAAIECIPTQTCFCQSDEGKRIFGESLNLGSNTLRHMQCGCSRLHEKIKRDISPSLQLPVVGPRCSEDGSFNPIQCIEKTCFCVDRNTGVVQHNMDAIHLDTHPITDLGCYDPNLDLFPQYSEGSNHFNYSSPCLDDLQNRIKLLLSSEDEGFNVEFGGGFTECYPDGTYGRIAYTKTGSKICVDNRGRKIGDFEASPRTPAFDTMDCKCAVTSHLMGKATEKPYCCKNGNFRKIQCRRGMCRCVDNDGRQTERETRDVEQLTCYDKDWRDC